MKHIAVYSVCIVKNVPPETGKVEQLMSLLGPQQHMYRGDSDTFSVIIDENYKNIAKEVFHSDFQCYEAPPGIELLHCIKYEQNFRKMSNNQGLILKMI
jgi:hypothetical protein